MALRNSTLLAARVTALAVPLWAGCVDDSVSIRVECTVMPEADDTTCIYNPEGECLGEGRLNIESANYYQGAVRVVSALQPRASDIPVQAETNNVTITEFEVDVLRSSGERIKFNSLPNPFRLPTSGFVPVGGVGIASGDFLPTAYVNQIKAAEMSENPLGQVIASVIIRGETQGKVEVETAPWRWPIRLFQISTTDPAQCAVFDTAVCNTGQDDFVNACADQSGD